MRYLRDVGEHQPTPISDWTLGQLTPQHWVRECKVWSSEGAMRVYLWFIGERRLRALRDDGRGKCYRTTNKLSQGTEFSPQSAKFHVDAYAWIASKNGNPFVVWSAK